MVDQVMKYIKKWVPSPRVAMLGGSSVHFDRAFLNREMPEITAYLKYQYVLSLRDRTDEADFLLGSSVCDAFVYESRR